MYENKKIFILGMARSGYEVAKLLSKHNNDILVTDGKDQDENHVKELEQLHIPVVITSNQEDLLNDSFDVVIKNPGIKYTNPCVLKAKKLGIPVVNELEVAYSFFPKDVTIIGVTGSNGKTTTVSLIYEILKREFSRVHLVGNIGYPVSTILEDIREKDILIVEISDHQLCDMYTFKTNISVLTNLSDTHTDFHDTHERYLEMKMRIFNHHTKKDFGVITFDDIESMENTENIESTKYYISSKTNQKCYLENGFIYYDNQKFISTKDICLKGIHNYYNIMDAIVVSKLLSVKDETIIQVLKEFNGVEHRLEYVGKFQGRSIYNDSKSTNNEATITALKSFQNPIRLLLGGLDRKQDFHELESHLKHVEKIYCFGETKNRILDFCKDIHMNCESFETMREAAIKSFQDSIEGDVILLSPACASWDQYVCFEDRGNEFKKIMKEMSEKSE